MSKKAILEIEIRMKQQILSASMLIEQLGYLKDKYPVQHTEAFLHALRVNDDKVTELKDLLEKLK